MPLVVLHTTESDPGTADAVAAYLRREKKSSNEVYDPSRDYTVSLIRAGQASMALRNESGGVETNRRDTDGIAGPDVYQIEIVGRAAQVPGYSEQWFRNLARHVVDVCRLTGTPVAFPCSFVPYPQSYGKRAAQRLSHAAWNAVNGVVGHQHVPENDHGDPGDLSRMVAIIKTEEEEMSQALVQPPDNHPLAGAYFISDGTHASWIPDGDTYALLRFLGARADANGQPFKLTGPQFDLLYPLVINPHDGRHVAHAAHPRYVKGQSGATTVTGPSAREIADELAKRLAT
jgi:hypothetical protein